MVRRGSTEAAATSALRANEKIAFSALAERRAFQQGRAFSGLLWFRLVFCGYLAVPASFYCIYNLLLWTPGQAPWAIAATSWCATLLMIASGVGAWPFSIEGVRYIVTDQRLLIVGRMSLLRSVCVGKRLVVGDVSCDSAGLVLPRGVVVRQIRPGIGTSVCAGGRSLTIHHHDWQDDDGCWHESETTLYGVLEPGTLAQHVGRIAYLVPEPCPRNGERIVSRLCDCTNAGRGEAEGDRPTRSEDSRTALPSRSVRAWVKVEQSPAPLEKALERAAESGNTELGGS
jgi:hypothetical protein